MFCGLARSTARNASIIWTVINEAHVLNTGYRIIMYDTSVPIRPAMKGIRLIVLLVQLSNYQPSATVKGHQKNRKTFSRLLMKQIIRCCCHGKFDCACGFVSVK
jgi:hypothetical protein